MLTKMLWDFINCKISLKFANSENKAIKNTI